MMSSFVWSGKPFLQTAGGVCKNVFMNETEISEKILAIAESAGLSPEEVCRLLDGGDIPEALKDVFESVADEVSGECGKN
ncbi:hypothetical protein [Maridesulfovibrio sp.]|uniref:hypothetical protein n=2 Tax=Maridesulfovibrio TaxID=2794998 RepID=UPI003AFF958E